MNGARVNEFPVNPQWVEVESNTNWQVALILLDLNVKVTFRHTSRTFTITTPSHTLGGKMEGLCGNMRYFSLLRSTIFYVSRQVYERRHG
jgi:von Willebrand factor type D domain